MSRTGFPPSTIRLGSVVGLSSRFTLRVPSCSPSPASPGCQSLSKKLEYECAVCRLAGCKKISVYAPKHFLKMKSIEFIANYFPNLERTYWTILSHYTTMTEPGLRAGKGSTWCWILGRGLYDHCTATRRSPPLSLVQINPDTAL